QGSQDVLRTEIARARELLPTLTPSEELIDFAARVAEEMKVDGHRAEITLVKTARVAAAFRGRQEPAREDIRDIMEMSLRHRVKRLPFEEKALDTRALDRLAGTFSDRRHL
ncbi:MAG: magnesium chelatase, partial [Candidatus Methylomirabilales bacterium]